MKKVFLLVLLVLSFGCASQKFEKENETLSEKNVTLTDHLRAGRYSDIYFSKQPKESDWAQLKEQGFTHIINFRESDEHDVASEKKKVKSLGMIYTHLPMDSSKPLDAAKVQLVTKAVGAHRDKGKTLIHCTSGNRVAYWAGAHFFIDHKYSEDQSIALAEDMGMTSSQLKSKLRTFIERQKSK